MPRRSNRNTAMLPTTLPATSPAKIPITDTSHVCPDCGGTNRVGVAETSRLSMGGDTLVWERCACAACGKVRIDKSILSAT